MNEQVPGSIRFQRGDESWVFKLSGPPPSIEAFGVELLAWLQKVFPELDQSDRRALINRMAKAIRQRDARGLTPTHVTVQVLEPGGGRLG